MDDSPATLGDVATRQQAARGRLLRRIGIVVLLLVVGVSASGVLDATVTSSAETGDATMTIDHPRSVRPGISLDLTITIESPEPQLTLVMPHSTLVDLGIESIWPEPAGSDSEGSVVRLTFDNPTGVTEIVATGRIDPGTPAGRIPLDVTVEGTSLTADTTVLVVP